MIPEENETAANIYVIPCEDSKKLNSESFVKEALRYKIIFFLHNGGLAAAFFYIAVLAKEQVGLSSYSIGAVLTVQMFLFIFTKPAIGYIADYSNSLKIVICVLSLLNITCFFSLLAIPKIDRGKMANFSTIFKDGNMTNVCSKCKDLLQFSPNSSIPTLMNSSNLNLTNVEIQSLSCMFCFHKNANYFNTSYTSFVLNSEETISFFNNADNNEKYSRLFCKQNGSLNKKNESNQIIFEQNIKNFSELCCLQNLETNLTLKNESFIQCSQMSKYFNSTENTQDSKKKINDFYTYQFWMFAILFSLSNICENANFTLVDTACCESIEKSKADFGKLRLWGNVGWGLFSAIGGLLNDFTGGFLASTVLMAVLLLSFLYNIIQMDLVKPHFSNTICRDVGTVFKSKEFLCFELVNFINGLGIGIIWYYLAWFITSLDGSQLLCGLSVTVQSFGGVIPFMFFSSWVIRKFGHYKILSFALMVNGFRFLFYSELYDPWWVLLIEFSHGITYGLYYAVLATYGKLKAKPGTEATTQSILFTTHEGLGAGIGCGFVGIGFDYFGTHQTFFYLGAVFGGSFFLSLLLYLFFVPKQRKLFTINPTS